MNQESIQNDVQNKAISDLNTAVDNPPQWLVSALSEPRLEQKITVEGCDIKVYQWGNPNNPPLILMHGFLAHSHCYAFIAPYLATHYNVVAFDHSGMGDSDWREEYSEEVRVKELIGVCQNMNLFNHSNQPIIISHSYGGRIGTAAVTSHGDLFSGLIICDLMIIRPEILKANADKFRPPGGPRNPNSPNRIYPDYTTAKGRFVLAPPQPVEQPYLLDFMAYHSLKSVDGGWQWKFDPKLFISTQNNEPSWGRIGHNVVSAPGRKAIVYGEQSYLFNSDSVRYVNELVENLEQPAIPMIGIPNARHHLMLDQPMAFLTALRSILVLWNK